MIGNLLIATNNNELVNCINTLNNNYKCIVIDDDIIQAPNFMGGSILLPLPSMLMTYVDTGNYSNFYTEYSSYLLSPELHAFITLIATALYNGSNIILYTNNSDPDMFLEVMRNVFAVNYGLNITSIYNMNSIPSINPIAIPDLLGNMLRYGYISNEKYESHFNQPSSSPFTIL